MLSSAKGFLAQTIVALILSVAIFAFFVIERVGQSGNPQTRVFRLGHYRVFEFYPVQAAVPEWFVSYYYTIIWLQFSTVIAIIYTVVKSTEDGESDLIIHKIIPHSAMSLWNFGMVLQIVYYFIWDLSFTNKNYLIGGAVLSWVLDTVFTSAIILAANKTGKNKDLVTNKKTGYQYFCSVFYLQNTIGVVAGIFAFLKWIHLGVCLVHNSNMSDTSVSIAMVALMIIEFLGISIWDIVSRDCYSRMAVYYYFGWLWGAITLVVYTVSNHNGTVTMILAAVLLCITGVMFIAKIAFAVVRQKKEKDSCENKNLSA